MVTSSVEYIESSAHSSPLLIVVFAHMIHLQKNSNIFCIKGKAFWELFYWLTLETKRWWYCCLQQSLGEASWIFGNPQTDHGITGRKKHLDSGCKQTCDQILAPLLPGLQTKLPNYLSFCFVLFFHLKNELMRIGRIRVKSLVFP